MPDTNPQAVVEEQIARHLDDWEKQSSRTRADYQTLAREVIAIVQAAPAVAPSAPADQAALRDRIAEAAQNGPTWLLPRSLAEEIADAVLAVLPATTDRAACPDPIECGHEAALGQAQQEIRRLGLMVDEYAAGARGLSEKLREERARAEAMTRAMESTAADALKHLGCHRDLMGQCLRAEKAEAAVERVRSVLESEAVVGRSALDYRGLITSALMADDASGPSRMAGEAQQPETQARRCAHNDIAWGLCTLPSGHDGDCLHEHQPRCGAWGGCTLRRGHNIGQADIPENHALPAAVSQPDGEA